MGISDMKVKIKKKKPIKPIASQTDFAFKVANADDESEPEIDTLRD
jgi:hypothetical protein